VTVPAPQGILVTGLPSSGTSWVGKMLQASGEVVYVNEPLNPLHPPGRSPGVLNADISHRFQYICKDNGDRWATAFADTLRLRYHPVAELRRNHAPYDLARVVKYGGAFTAGRLRHRRALIDDPYAVHSAGWFAERLGCQVVVLVRHPVSFVGSWQRLGWRANLPDLLEQPLLMRDMLAPYAGELEAVAHGDDQIVQTVLLWRATYAAIGELAERSPGLLHLQRYEDLAANPEQSFRDLYARCGLSWTDEARQRVIEATTAHAKPKGAQVWSLRGGLSRTAFRPMDSTAALGSFRDRLTPEEIDRVRELTADVAGRYYTATEGLTPA
jgi:hypothetical protein